MKENIYLLELETTITSSTLIQKIFRKVESAEQAMEIIDKLRNFDQYGEPLKVRAKLFRLKKMPDILLNGGE